MSKNFMNQFNFVAIEVKADYINIENALLDFFNNKF